MVFEHIERLKRTYTDQRVRVKEERPELLRFRGQTGQVKTVNMNGNALVEFDGFNNIGWYDIHLEFLRLVDPPTPASAKSKEANITKQPAKPQLAKHTASPPPPKTGEKKPSGKKANGEKPRGMTVKQMLAAARGEKSGGAQTSFAPEPSLNENEERKSVIAAMESARTKSDSQGADTQPSAKQPSAKQSSAKQSSAKLAAPSAFAKFKVDELKIVEGIGPRIENVLKAAGVAYCRRVDAS